MSFSKRVFYSIFLTSILICFCAGITLFSIVKDNIEKDYFNKYEYLLNLMSSTFQQLEISANLIIENAVRVLYQIEKNTMTPTDLDLKKLAEKLYIKDFYIINASGKFIRSSNLPIELQVNSLFTYCKSYKNLINGSSNVFVTPIVPDFPKNIPMKFIMISNHNKNFILEAGIELEYIGKILHEAVKSDKTIKSIGFYTPSGVELGFLIGSAGYTRGGVAGFKNILEEPSYRKLNNIAIYNKKVSSLDGFCCECIYKKISDPKGQYYYLLRMEVSLDPLLKKLNLLKLTLILLLFFSILLSYLISKILTKSLTSRINRINATANEILNSSNLNLKVKITEKPDEISHLADTFNKMTHALKVSQEVLVESEKMHAIVKIAGELAHDIRSPLAVMEITLISLQNNIPNSQKLMLSEAIQNVRDIANNLLARYRQTNENPNVESAPLTYLPQDDGNITRPVLLSSIIELVLSQKRQEWSLYPCQLSSTIETLAIDQWIEVAPNNIKRVLSNLLNNAYEALGQNRSITVSLEKVDDTLCLKIIDTGCGIPPEKINEVMNGLSLKHEGQGLGLTSSKNYLDNIGAQLSLISTESVGTEVTISFPIMTIPSWFPLAITIPKTSVVIILDDDTSIHNLWRHRLGSYDVKCYHFLSSKEILEWRKDNLSIFNEAILLIDYELKNDTKNGLVLFEMFNAQSRGYLITSHHEEVFIQQQCERLGINLIAKSLMGVVATKLI